MTPANGSSNLIPVAPPLFALVQTQGADLILRVLEKGQLQCFPEDKRFLADSPLEVALEGLCIYQDGLDIILATHFDFLAGKMPKSPVKCFGLTQGTACLFCEKELEDNQFGAKIRMIGLQVSADPVWSEQIQEDDGFDPLQIEAEIAANRLIFVFTCDNGHVFESYFLAAKGLPCEKCGHPVRLAGQA